MWKSVFFLCCFTIAISASARTPVDQNDARGSQANANRRGPSPISAAERKQIVDGATRSSGGQQPNGSANKTIATCAAEERSATPASQPPMADQDGSRCSGNGFPVSRKAGQGQWFAHRPTAF